MKNLSSWIITFFIIAFWLLRVIVAIMGATGDDFIIKPADNNVEIALLFIVLALVPFIFKRKLWASIIYLGAYGWYFGKELVPNVISMAKGETISNDVYISMFIGLIAITLALAALIDMLLDRSRLKNPVNKETDWFYKNKDYDRQLDERADKNNYRTL